MARPPNAVGEVVLDADAIRVEVARLGAQISADYVGRRPHLVGVLKGAAVFVADLIRAIDVPTTLDFISIVPYPEASRSGVVRIRKDLDDPIEGKDVIVVEGVCASGLSLSYLMRNFETRQPDLVICDITMPKLDGYGTLKAMRERESTASIPFIFLTGATEKSDIRRGMAIMFNGEPCRVLDFHHHTPGNLRAMVQAKLRRLKTGTQIEHRFRSTDTVDVAELDIGDSVHISMVKSMC